MKKKTKKEVSKKIPQNVLRGILAVTFVGLIVFSFGQKNKTAEVVEIQNRASIEKSFVFEDENASIFSAARSFFSKVFGGSISSRQQEPLEVPLQEPAEKIEKNTEKLQAENSVPGKTYTRKELAGSYRCYSYNTGAMGGGGGVTGGRSSESIVPSTLGLGQNCRLFAPIVIKDDGKYEMSKEKGTYKIQGETIVLSESKLRGAGTILESGLQIRFEYDHNASHHTITYLREAEAKKPKAGKKFIEVTLQVQFPVGDYSADSVNTVTLFDAGTGEQIGETLAYPLDRQTIEAYFSKRPPKTGLETGKIYNVFVSSGFGGWQIGKLDLRGVTKDSTEKIFAQSEQNAPKEITPPAVQSMQENSIPTLSPELQPQSGEPCNPSIPRYQQSGCIE